MNTGGMNETITEWFRISAAAAVVVFCLWLIYRWYLIIKHRRLANKITTATGYVKCTTRNLEQLSVGWRNWLFPEPFPAHLNRYIKSYKPQELARYMLDNVVKEPSLYRYDVHRALTIAAALFDQTLPASLFLLDSRTAALWQALKKDLKCVFVLNERTAGEDDEKFQLFDSKIMTEIALARYTAQLQKLATLLLHFANQGSYPSFEVFYKTFELNVQKLHRDNNFTQDELKSMVSALAILTCSQIPRSYIRVDSITQAIVERPAPAARIALTRIK